MTAALAIASLAWACTKPTDSQPAKRTTRAAPKKAPSFQSARKNALRWMSLFGEVARAEFRVGGSAIDMGTPDQAKYTRGGWNTGWSKTDCDGQTTCAAISRETASLTLFSRHPSERLAIRVRSQSGTQTLQVKLGEQLLGTEKVGPTWKRIEMPLGPLAMGPQTMFFKRSGDAPVWVDWVWLGADETSPPSLEQRTEPLPIAGRVRRALTAETPRSYSFYLPVPHSGRLITDLGATGGDTRFLVRVETTHGEITTLARLAASRKVDGGRCRPVGLCGSGGASRAR